MEARKSVTSLKDKTSTMAQNSLLKKMELSIRKFSIQFLKLIFKKDRIQGKLPIEFQNAKVLFLRQNQIGDALISAPIFKALKEAYPTLIIDVLLDRRNQFVFDTNPYIRNKWLIKLRRFDFLSTLRAIRRENYDVVIDLIHSASSTSTIFTLFSNARFSVGFLSENDFIYNHAYALNSKKRMMSQLAEVLKSFLLDPKSVSLAPYFFLSASSNEFANEEISKMQAERGKKPLLLLNLSSSREEKFWGKERFKQLILALEEQRNNYAIGIVCSKGDRALAEEICTGTNAYLFSETTRFESFAALISKAQFLFTPDSAAAHLADAFNIPSLILTHLPPGNTEWYPSNTRHIVLHSTSGDVKSISLNEVLSAFFILEKNTSGNNKS